MATLRPMTQATTEAATNDNDREIRIPLSKWKLILLLIGGALLIAACIWVFRNAETLKRADPILSTIFGFIGIVFFSMCFGFGIIQLFDKKPGLIINKDGIVNNTTALNTQHIRWENITGWETLNMKGTKILLVFVNNPEEIIANANNFSRFWLKLNMKSYGTPVSISNNSLWIKFSKLVDVFTEYYSKAKAPSSPNL